MTLQLTPERFVQMVVLGLFWEHGGRVEYRTKSGDWSFRDGWTTVNHILKVFQGLEVITKTQVTNVVQHKTNGLLHQRRLLRHSGISYGSSYVSDNISWIQVRQGNQTIGKAPNLLKLVLDQSIQITDLGRAKATEFQESFLVLGITQEMYCAKSNEIEATFRTDRASAAASSKFRLKVRELLSDS